MDLAFSPEIEAFRKKVRNWFETDFPEDIIRKYKAGLPLTTAEVRRSEMALRQKGWLATAWPEEYGGPAGGSKNNTSSTRSWNAPACRRSRPWASSMSAR
jgi:alkylation response protein AidB-like acyl-CoA dehydrogenase